MKEEGIQITEQELATLISESDGEHLISAVYGPGFLALRVVPENRWALKRICEMRGIGMRTD